MKRFLLLAALLTVSALPIFRDDFLFSDDYYWYDIQHSRPYAAVREATQMNISNGRPVHNLLFVPMFPLLAHRTGWLFARALGVLALCGCLFLLSRALRKRFDDARADWIAFLILLLPGFVLFAFWIIGVPCLVADAGAIAAYWAMRKDRPWLAGALLFIALCAYQPLAMIYFALVAYHYATEEKLDPKPVALGLLTLVAYFPFSKLLVALYDFGMPGRGDIVFAPVQKISWFFKDALPFAAKFWSIIGSERVAVGVMLAAFVGAAVIGRHRPNPKRIAFVAVALGLTVLPHLIVRETVTRWRVLLPLSIGLLLVWAVLARVERWPVQTLVALALVALGARTYELEIYGVAPERAQITAAASGLHGEKHAFVVRPTFSDALCVARVSNDEFTAPSSQHDFAAAGIVRIAADLAHVPRPLRVSHDNDIGVAPRDAAVLDLRHMPCKLPEQRAPQKEARAVGAERK